MCYSKEYEFSDGNPEFYNIGLTSQLAACKTSYLMSGGSKKYSSKFRSKTKRSKKYKRKTKSKRKKYIRVY